MSCSNSDAVPVRASRPLTHVMLLIAFHPLNGQNLYLRMKICPVEGA